MLGGAVGLAVSIIATQALLRLYPGSNPFMLGALGLAQAIRGLLFGVPANDPVVFVSIPLLLMLVALAAVAIPAFRASRIDPLEVLRIE